MKIVKGDKVKIIKGKDRGKDGVVDKVLLEENKIVIDGINVYKKHQKGSGDKNQGGIITINKPLRVENVRLICSKCSQPTRIGYKIEGDGKKYRVCKKCKEVIN